MPQSVSVCSTCPDLLLLCRFEKSTANASASPSVVARYRLRVPTAQLKLSHLDPQPATHLLHRYTSRNQINQSLDLEKHAQKGREPQSFLVNIGLPQMCMFLGYFAALVFTILK